MRIDVCFVAVAGLIVLSGCAQGRSSVVKEPPATVQTRGGGTTTVAGSCVDQYSLDALKKRDYAFDGTVTRIEPGSGRGGEEGAPDRVTFTANKWFKGGSGQAAVRRAYGFTSVTSAGGSPHRIGERLLVAGDEDFIWECGFTQSYDAKVAAD